MTSSQFTFALIVFSVLLGIVLTCLELMCLKRSVHLGGMSVWILGVVIVNSMFILSLILAYTSYFFLFIFPIPLIPFLYWLAKSFLYNKYGVSHPIFAPNWVIILSFLSYCIIAYVAYTGFKKINPTESNLVTAIREEKNSKLRIMLAMSVKQEPTLTNLINQALSVNNADAVQRLIKKGADPRREYWLQQVNDSLQWVMVSWMLEKGVKPTEINTVQSPGIEHLAVRYTEKELKYCIEKGFDPKAYPYIIDITLNEQRLKSASVIDLEETQSMLNKMKVLLEHGAAINGGDQQLYKPIISVILFELEMDSVLSFMLEKGADANAKTETTIGEGDENVLHKGATPLMLAVYLNKPSYLELLLAHGAEKTIKDSSGLTAWDYAVKGNASEEIKRRVKL